MQIVVRHGLSNQIVKINERIDELNQNKETYAIESFPSEIWNSSSIETDPEWYASFCCLFAYLILVLEFEVVFLVLVLLAQCCFFLFHNGSYFFCIFLSIDVPAMHWYKDRELQGSDNSILMLLNARI